MPATGPGATKICNTCGRSVRWRTAWARVWDEVRSCSKSCRHHKPNRTDRALEQAIVKLLRSGPPGRAMTSPAEAAQEVGGEDWRPSMERARRAARRLAAAGVVEIIQRGRLVDPSSFVGPILLRRGAPQPPF